ncbi:23S rRNA (guanosine(2251)-2'-O)-methyltransferase RlmB [Deferribacterales bacterium Es71-Z0220]|jgi:23S rRNA (guanosine2251-2'-O)-methyltransferase|uniref:23S rRNA (guanosine(2251)-2'-O)-methyltransferase RlmB n=1 Tax=Deferrivibrio essentukiensis TaxID=2880922 RepID=UPI001F60F037|nr:23S rRNA (guanosine(2251)-2'-O)-methyltransferase RlmB [Deferrivibrio essentukiensis]MBZ4672033.1 methyltransferase, TrmH family [Deferribacteraceae bacterium]MCB4205033.1 23S rRNA (guanosine(2251)-2'-O)-methyltransferase RlmB [Deferrivibrio essentukiensis]
MLIYGKNALFEALKAHTKIKEIFLRDGVTILNNVNIDKIKVTVLKKNDFELKFPDKNQGVVADIDFKTYDFYDVVEELKDEKCVAVLDHIQDPHNYGAIIRAGHCFGVKFFIVAKDNQCKITPTVFKTSAGSLIYSKVVEVVNIAKTLDEIKKMDFYVYAADVHTERYISSVSSDGKKAVVIGSEGNGIRPNVLKRADIIFKIPMVSNIDSLNASQSAAIAFYELCGKWHG